jgi:hypothetical protein
MMEKTALGSRSSCAEPAWPSQVQGAVLPDGSSRRKSEAQISSPRHHHRSLLAARSHKASRARITSEVHRILARDPADNQYP